MRLDPSIEQVGAGHGYWWVIREDGSRTAWQEEWNRMICPVCKADPEEMPNCAECAGRGVVDHIPFADRPWDEIEPGLWLGGHVCQNSGLPPNGDCFLGDADFDVVISLHEQRTIDPGTATWAIDKRYEPREGTEHYRLRMADADLDPAHHTGIDELARIAYEALLEKQKVLVRCLAGLNRSSLIVALTLMHVGYSADEAIAHIRSVRSPYALCNQSFVDYLHQKENARD